MKPLPPAPPLLAPVPFTDAVNAEFTRTDEGTSVISNAFAALDAGLQLPSIRTFSQHGVKTFGWQWRVEEPWDNVQAYPEVKCGRKPWDPKGSSTTDLLPKRLGDVRGLSVDLKFSLDASGSCNAAFDLWLLKTKDGGPREIAAEVMVWMAMQGSIRPAGSDAKAVPSLDATLYRRSLFDAGGQPWPVYTYLPNAPTRDGEVNLTDFLQDLTARGLVSPDLYLSSVEFGTELLSGDGWCAVERFQVNLT